MKKKNIVGICALLAVIGSSFYLLYKNKVIYWESDRQMTLRLTLDNSSIDSLDPAKSYSDDSLLLSAQVLEPLFQYHYLKRPYEVQPLVAQALPLLQDEGRLITVKIKKGIFFHEHPAFKGRPRELRADDFVNQFKRISFDNLKSPGKSLFTGLIVGFDNYSLKANSNWKNIPKIELEGVRALDAYTLELKLLKTEPNIIHYLGLNFLSPVPWELIEYYQNILDDVLIGTGPYVYEGFKDNYFSMKKFKSYRKDFYPTSGDRYANVQKLLDSSKEKIPFIDNIRFYISNDEMTRWDLFLKKEIDLLTVPKTLIPKLYENGGELSVQLQDVGAELKHFPILANRWLGFNMKNPLVGKNKFLRLAIAHAIDFNKYIQMISQNTNLRANSLLVPGISGYRPTRDFRFNYDLKIAKDYMKKAKIIGPVRIRYSTRGNQGINIIEANFIKDQLKLIGIDIEIEVLTFSEFLKKGRAGELMFFTDNWLFDYPDGENIIQLLISTNSPGINKSGYTNTLIDKLYSDLKRTTNIDQREKILQNIEDIVLEDIPWIPLMYESSLVLQYPEIKNYRKSSLIRNYIKYLKIER